MTSPAAAAARRNRAGCRRALSTCRGTQAIFHCGLVLLLLKLLLVVVVLVCTACCKANPQAPSAAGRNCRERRTTATRFRRISLSPARTGKQSRTSPTPVRRSPRKSEKLATNSADASCRHPWMLMIARSPELQCAAELMPATCLDACVEKQITALIA